MSSQSLCTNTEPVPVGLGLDKGFFILNKNVIEGLKERDYSLRKTADWLLTLCGIGITNPKAARLTEKIKRLNNNLKQLKKNAKKNFDEIEKIQSSPFDYPGMIFKDADDHV